jgi:cap2 methyltransferase
VINGRLIIIIIIIEGDYLLISDIRTANFRAMTAIENEEHILQDNRLQMRWVEMMRPRKVVDIVLCFEKAILKFRCVYPSEIVSPTIFLKGDILIQPWAP